MRLITKHLIGFTLTVLSGIVLAKQTGSLPTNKNQSISVQESVMAPGSRLAEGDADKNEFYILSENEPDPVKVQKPQEQKVENKQPVSDELKTTSNANVDLQQDKPKAKETKMNVSVHPVIHHPTNKKLASHSVHHEVKKEKLASNPVHHAMKKEKLASNPVHHAMKKEKLASNPVHHAMKKEKLASNPVHHAMKKEKLASNPVNHAVKKEKLASNPAHHAVKKAKLASNPLHEVKKEKITLNQINREAKPTS